MGLQGGYFRVFLFQGGLPDLSQQQIGLRHHFVEAVRNLHNLRGHVAPFFHPGGKIALLHPVHGLQNGFHGHYYRMNHNQYSGHQDNADAENHSHLQPELIPHGFLVMGQGIELHNVPAALFVCYRCRLIFRI